MGTLYIKHASGAMHALSGQRYAKLHRELAAGRGQPEMAALIASGYAEFLDTNGELTCIDDGEALARCVAAQGK